MLKKTKMDKTLYPLKGIVPIVNTPFTESNIIDYDSVNRLIEQGIKDGIAVSYTHLTLPTICSV